MNGREEFRSAFLDTRDFDPEVYRYTVDAFQRATMAALAPVPSKLSHAMHRRLQMP